MATAFRYAPGFGDRLRSLRHKRLETLREFAATTGVTYQSLSKWENGDGEPLFRMLKKIAEATGADIDWLAQGKE